MLQSKSKWGWGDVPREAFFQVPGAAVIPIALDPAVMAVAVAGRGHAALRRLAALRTGGVCDPLLYSDQPDGELMRIAGTGLRGFLPGRSDLAAMRVLWIAGLPDDLASELAARARSQRVLVNVEDRPAQCDFHSVAEVRRGKLLLTVSTGGSSPRFAARIRARLANEFGPEWADRLALLHQRRAVWRREGRDVAAQTDELLRANGWFV